MEVSNGSSSHPGTTNTHSAATAKKCKWGARCNRKNCKFVHPFSSVPAATSAAVPTNGAGGGIVGHVNIIPKDSGVSDDSSRGTDASMAATTKTKATAAKKPNAVTPKSKIKKCRFGDDCRNIGTTCRFKHPSDTVVATVVTPVSSPASKKDQHDGARNAGSGNAVAAASVSADGTKTSKKQKTKKMKRCRFGRNCKSSNCPFSHPDDILEPSPSQCTITASEKHPSPTSENPTPEFLTVAELESALVASVTDAPNGVDAFATSQQQPVPSHSVDYDDIEELLREQEMERLELATSNASVPGLGAVASENFYQGHHQPHLVTEQQRITQVQGQAELEHTRQRLAELEKQLEFERQKRLEAEKMAMQQPQLAQQQPQRSNSQKATKPRNTATAQKAKTSSRSQTVSAETQARRVNEEEAEARRRAEVERVKTEKLKQEEALREAEEERKR